MPWRGSSGQRPQDGTMSEAIPPEVTAAVAEFMAAGRTGNVTLNGPITR